MQVEPAGHVARPDPARLVLAVDGGQTATRAVVLGRDGTVLHRSAGEPLTLLVEPGGRERLEAVLDAIAADLENARIDPAVAFLCLTAFTPGTPAQGVSLELAEMRWPGAEVVVEGDGLGAWAGATGGAPGVVAMAGTGSVVIAVNEAGAMARTGGWGWVLGDPGSGWAVGSGAIRAMLERWDRDGTVSALGRTILAATGATDPADVADRVYARTLDVPAVARLTEVVAALARDGDRESAAVLAAAARAFVPDVVAAIERLPWAREPVLVATLGGTFRTGDAYRDAFRSALVAASRRAVRLADPLLSGLGGTALLALRRSGVEPSPALVRRLRDQGLGADDRPGP